MRVLLDTHVLLWTLEGNPRLGANAAATLEDPANECWVSAVSLWEIAIKSSLGRLQLARPLVELEGLIAGAGLRLLSITPRHAVAYANTPATGPDPFDRLLLAQCEVETLRLLSADRALQGVAGVLAV